MGKFLLVFFEIVSLLAIVLCLKQGYFVALIPNILSGIWIYIQLVHPKSALAKALGFELSPLPVSGMKRSDYALKLSLFSSKCMLLLSVVWSLFFLLKVDPESHPILMGLFALVIPLLFAMALAVVVFQMGLYAYISITGRDSEFNSE